MPWHSLSSYSIQRLGIFVCVRMFTNVMCRKLVSMLCQSAILGAFCQVVKNPISFVMSVCQFTSLHAATARLQPNGFWWNCILETFAKICWETLSLIKIKKKSGILHDHLSMFTVRSCWILTEIKQVSVKSCTENQNKHVISILSLFIWKIVQFMRELLQFQGGHRSMTTVWHKEYSAIMPNNSDKNR